jgi:hypothetical protein
MNDDLDSMIERVREGLDPIGITGWEITVTWNDAEGYRHTRFSRVLISAAKGFGAPMEEADQVALEARLSAQAIVQSRNRRQR